MNLLPTVTKPNNKGGFVGDVYSALLQDRIIILDEPVTDSTVGSIVAQMLHLESVDEYEPIVFYICTGGGAVDSGLFLVDMMSYIKPPVLTVCGGKAFSMGSVLLSCGQKRYITPNSSVMIHTVSSASIGKVDDMEVSTERSRELNTRIFNILAKNCGRTYEEIERLTTHDYFMNAQQSLEFGIVDEILQPYRGKIK